MKIFDAFTWVTPGGGAEKGIKAISPKEASFWFLG